MKKLFKSQKLMSFFAAAKPWLGAIVLLVVLRATGALASITDLTQTAIFETGIMDATPAKAPAKPVSFDYNFVLKDLNGNKVDVSQFKNKVIFLNLWATWCGPCRVEMPSIQSLYDKLDKERVAFLMLSLDTEENQPKVVRYVNDKSFTFPVYTPHEYLPGQLKVSSIPTTFIVGKDGKIKDKKVGASNYDSEKFVKYMNDLIAE